MKKYYISTSEGKIITEFSGNKLTKVGRPNKVIQDVPKLINQKGENGQNIIQFFDYFFKGDFKKADELKNKIEIELDGTDFQKKVWLGIKGIDVGHTLSYKELSNKIGSKAIQAVGTACGKNPLPMLIPCHRVIANGSKIGGWSGKINKERLLKREGINL